MPHKRGVADRQSRATERKSAVRKLDERCALRAIDAPGFLLVRFRWSDDLCGQGQDRTVDLPLFRRTLIPTELPDQARCSAMASTAAVLTGFEPATSTLTGWRALRLLYRTLLCEASRSSLARAYHRRDDG